MKIIKLRKGFLILEILTGFMIFVFFLGAFLFALIQLNHNLVSAGQKLHRTQQLKNKIENLKTLTYEQLKLLPPSPELSIKEIKPDLLEAVLVTLNEKWVWRLTR